MVTVKRKGPKPIPKKALAFAIGSAVVSNALLGYMINESFNDGHVAGWHDAMQQLPNGNLNFVQHIFQQQVPQVFHNAIQDIVLPADPQGG